MPLPSFLLSISRTMILSELRAKVEGRIRYHHGRCPGLRNVPLPVVGIIAFLAFINVLVWVAAGVILVSPTPLPLRKIKP